MQQLSLVVLAGLALSTPAAAQQITPLLESGTLIPGIGSVVNVNGVAVDDAGHVIVRAYTDNPNPDLRDALLDEFGNVLAFAGQTLTQPTGASIRGFYGGNMMVSPNGTPTYLLWLAGTTGPIDDTGVYYGLPPSLVVQFTNAATAPQLPSGSTITELLYPKINDSQKLCFHAVVDTPGISGMYDTPALMTVDPQSGAQNVIAKRGDVLPGQTWGISDFGWNRHQLSWNNAGHAMYVVGTYASSNMSANIYLDYTKLAQSSFVSPFGSSYTGFSSVSLNNHDEYAFRCALNDPVGESGIVLNGAAFAQFGDSFPSIEPFALNYFGTPVFLGDDGRMIWSGTWNSPAGPQGTGIFADHDLLVSVGATVINGSVVQDLTLLDGSFTASANGRYLVFQATLANGINGAYMIDLAQ